MNKLSHVAIIMDGNGRWGLKKNLKDKKIGEDELKKYEKKIQNSTDEQISALDKKLGEKEKDIMTV